MNTPSAIAAVSRPVPAPSVRRPMKVRRSSTEMLRMRRDGFRDAGERDASGRNEDAVGGHGSFDLVQSADSTGDAGACFEHDAGRRGRGKLERANGGDAQLKRTIRRAGGRRRDGDAADLREHLDQNHRWDDRLPGKVSLKVEVVRVRVP